MKTGLVSVLYHTICSAAVIQKRQPQVSSPAPTKGVNHLKEELQGYRDWQDFYLPLEVPPRPLLNLLVKNNSNHSSEQMQNAKKFGGDRMF